MIRPTLHQTQLDLLHWYDRAKRDLPWRRTRDPYAIWISEIMLQQTRVAAVIPYYQRFLKQFPDPAALAAAPEEDLLTAWAGLGYYSRARNLQKAARQIVEHGGFPRDYEEILKLAGIGAYTAAAVASIAFDQPRAVVDGNVRRVLARLHNDAGLDVNPKAAQAAADQLLERDHPARWNQAVMELGATVCVPKNPLCLLCPVAKSCAAHKAGTQNEIPAKRVKPEAEQHQRTLLVIRRAAGETEEYLLAPSPRVKGFWDLPEPFPGAREGAELGAFKHTITHRNYTFTVREAKLAKNAKAPASYQWIAKGGLHEIPLGTTAKKALRLAEQQLEQERD